MNLLEAIVERNDACHELQDAALAYRMTRRVEDFDAEMEARARLERAAIRYGEACRRVPVLVAAQKAKSAAGSPPAGDAEE